MYMQSNQPYSRVEDSVWNGAFLGAGVGAAAAGAGQMWGKKGIDYAMGEGRVNRALAKQKDVYATDGVTNEERQKATSRVDKALKSREKTKDWHNKAFGSGKGKAISYGASVLAGGLVGGMIDSANH